MADYKTPQWLLPNEKNLAYPAAGAETGSGLSEDRHSLYSMDFTGLNTINYSTPVDLGVVSTFSFWMNIDVGTTGALFGNTALGTFEYVVYYSGSQFLFKIAGAFADFPNAAAAISTGQWHHVAFVRPSENEVKCYIDSVLTDTITSWSGTPGSNPIKFDLIGSRPGGGLSYSGKIDEICGFKRALSGTEVAALSVADAPANVMALPDKPYVYYPLGEQAQMGSANWSFPNGSLQSHVVDFNSASSESIILSTSASFKVQAQTVSMWVKPELNTRDPLFLNGHTSVGNVGFEVYQDFGNIRVRINGSSQIIGAVNIGEWNHIFAAYDGADLKYSVNGATIATYNFAATISYSFYTGLILGNSAYGYYDGQTSNVAFWTSDQSSNYVDAYNNGSPQSTYTATPTAWWKLNAANSSYVYPWTMSITGDPDYTSSDDGCYISSGVLKWRDTGTAAFTDTFDWYSKEITGANTNITISSTGGEWQGESSSIGLRLFYKIDGGSWVQFQEETHMGGYSSTAWTLTAPAAQSSSSSFQLKVVGFGGAAPNSYVTLNDITVTADAGTLYTESFTDTDGTGFANGVYTPPPVDWTFIDTETPAPNYTSALNFVSGDSDYIDLSNNSSLYPGTGDVSYSAWIKPSSTTGFKAIFGVQNLNTTAKGVNVQIYNGEIWVFVGVGVSGQWGVNTGGSTGGGGFISSGANLTLNNWHHIAFTFNRDGNGVIYINGVANRTAAANPNDYSSVDITSTSNVFLGRGNGYFDGEISNAAIFNTSLDAAAISTLFNSGTPQTSISSSPISWWKLNNTTTGIQDSGSASNNGTNNGATQIATNVLISNNGESDTLPTSALIPSDLQFESPYSNYSLSFDGIGNYIDCGTELGDSLGTYTGDLSLSYWFNTDSLTDNNGLFYIGSFSNTQGEFQVNIFSNSMRFRVEGGTQTKLLDITSLSTGTWYHIAFVYKAGNISGSKVYLNGVEQSTTDTGTFPSSLSFTGLKTIIGGYYGTANTFGGKMDEVAIWNTALTQAQITQVYNNGYPNDLTSLSPTSWWRLGEDAYFVGNDITIPNQITGGSTGTGAGTQTAILVGDAPGSYANGSGTNLAVEDRIGDAPESTANSVSINMIPSNRHSYPAGYVPTQVDNAFSMEFDGLNDYFDIGNLQPSTTSLSISAWAYKTDTSQASIIGRGASVDYGIFVYGGSLQFGLNSGSWSTITTSIPTVNTWFHVCATWDGTSMKLYVNGALASSASKTGTITYTSNNTTIGKNSTLSGFEWDGKIDEVALFNYALSERQIKQDIYEGTTTGKTADLNNISNLTAPVAWYRMGD